MKNIPSVEQLEAEHLAEDANDPDVIADMASVATDKEMIDYLQAHEGRIECDNGLFEVSCAAPWGAGDARKDLRSAIKHAMSRARPDLNRPNKTDELGARSPEPIRKPSDKRAP